MGLAPFPRQLKMSKKPSVVSSPKKRSMESGELVVLVMAVCVAGCVCAICAIEHAFSLCERRQPLLEATGVQ